MTESGQEMRGIQSEQEPKLPVVEYAVGRNLTIAAVPIEHQSTFHPERYERQLHEAVGKSDGVILEYFPPELAEVAQNPIARISTNYKDFIKFFSSVEGMAFGRKKPVYALDPAHDSRFAVIRLIPYALAISGMGSMVGAPFLLHKNRYIAGACFAAGFLTWLPGAAMMSIKNAEFRWNKNFGLPIHTESTLRRAIVARGLRQMGRALDADPDAKPKKLLLIYPPGHWQGIKKYLDDDKLLAKDFRFYANLKKLGKDYAKSWFTIRRYDPAGGGWSAREEEIR